MTSRITIRVVARNRGTANLAPLRGVQRVFGWSERRGVSLTGASVPSCGIHPPLLELSQDVRHTQGSSHSKRAVRLTHRPIIERKQVIVGNGVSLWICFRGQMTSADSCFPIHRKRCTFLAKVVKKKWFVEVFVTFFPAEISRMLLSDGKRSKIIYVINVKKNRLRFMQRNPNCILMTVSLS